MIKKIKNMTISSRITLIYTLLFSVILFVASCFVITNMWVYYNSTSKNELIKAADKIEDHILSGGEITKDKLREVIDNNYIEARVMSRDYDINAGTMPRLDMYPKDNTDSNNLFGSKFRDKNFGIKQISEAEYMFAHRQVEYEGRIYNIDVFRLFNHEQAVINIFLILFIIINIATIFAAYIIGRYISRKMLRPIREITETADNISINDLEQRIEVPEANDEIKKLIITFNDMISRLDEAFKKQKQFISDASHELKTPIAVIQGYVNLIDRWGKSDEAILKESIDSIKSETTHMTNLVEQLLFLARADNNKSELTMNNVSLNSIAIDVVKDINVLNSDVETEIISTGEAEILGDINLIRQLMWIFCENAMKYHSSRPLKIIISTGYKDTHPYFSVKDNGIGISQEALPHIFDRFYRADKSRNKIIEGNGLGLSIADWIIKMHNAKIVVMSEKDKGSEFIVIFNNQ